MKLLWTALCLTLAGCASKPAAERVRIGIGGQGLQPYLLTVPLAEALGYFREEGVEAILEPLPSSGKGLQALVGGSVDVGALTYFQTVQMAAEGQKLRSIFVISRRSVAVLVVGPAGMGTIRRIEDLKGQAVGVPSQGAGSDQWFTAVLANHGMQAADVSRVAIGTGASAISALESGRLVAGVLNAGNHLRMLQRHPELRVLLDGTTPAATREVYGVDDIAMGAVMAKQEWLDGHPETARRLARALRRAQQWIVTHKPEEIRDKLPSSMRTDDAASDVAVVRWGMDAFSPDGRMPKGTPEASQRFLAGISDKVRDAKIDLVATWTDEYLEKR